MMSTLHCVRSLARDTGGPARTVPALCEHLAQAGVRVQLLTTDLGPRLGPLLLPEPALTPTHVAPRWRLAARWDAVCRTTPVDLIHEHGIWAAVHRAAARTARRRKIPRIVAPRGMLSPWALAQKRYKKQLAWRLYARRDIASAAVLHATSMLEANDLRALGLRQPIAIVPNGVACPEQVSTAPRPTAPHEILFLSRIHPKKGLLDLVQAWNALRPPDWRVIVAGPDEQNHRATVEAALREANLQHTFDFVGPVEGEQKRALLERASLFVLPTYSENFGVVVAEALAAGVPVITTRAAPWKLLEDERCGWWTDVGAAPLAAALREALALCDQERAAMGERGHAVVRDEFGWPRIAIQMRAVYDWVLGGGALPDVIRKD